MHSMVLGLSPYKIEYIQMFLDAFYPLMVRLTLHVFYKKTLHKLTAPHKVRYQLSKVKFFIAKPKYYLEQDGL
ncbi:Uncharacterised protein [Yersinia aldovae]|nr:Uncharacterised protein [Yersinia aldovae]